MSLALQDDSTLLDRISGGEFPAHLAAQFGVTKQAIYKRFKGNPAYQEAREIGAESRLDEAVETIRQCAEPVALARAREHFRAVAWQAEREFPHRWGQKSEHTVNVVDWTSELRAAKERVIQGESQVIDSVGVQSHNQACAPHEQKVTPDSA